VPKTFASFDEEHVDAILKAAQIAGVLTSFCAPDGTRHESEKAAWRVRGAAAGLGWRGRSSAIPSSVVLRDHANLDAEGKHPYHARFRSCVTTIASDCHIASAQRARRIEYAMISTRVGNCVETIRGDICTRSQSNGQTAAAKQPPAVAPTPKWFVVLRRVYVMRPDGSVMMPGERAQQ